MTEPIKKKPGRPRKTPVEEAVDKQVENLQEEAPAPKKEAGEFTFMRGDALWTGYWWPTSSTAPTHTFVKKGRRFEWSVPGSTGEIRVHRGNVVGWRDEGSVRHVCVWKTLREFQINVGEGFIPQEPPLTRGARAIVSGPGRNTHDGF